MPIYLTQLRAQDARNGEIKSWVGPNIEAPSWGLAQEWCYLNCGYLTVIGQLVSEVPCKEGTLEPDWEREVNYEGPSLN